MTIGIEEHDSKAALEAGRFAGEYLDEIGKTDLATLTPEEWKIFCEVICGNFLITRLDQIPY